MPTKCKKCPFYEPSYCYNSCSIGTKGIKERYGFDESTRPSWCPIKCDIKDIKSEIQELNTYYHAPDALNKALTIIDKQIR